MKQSDEDVILKISVIKSVEYMKLYVTASYVQPNLC